MYENNIYMSYVDCWKAKENKRKFLKDFGRTKTRYILFFKNYTANITASMPRIFIKYLGTVVDRKSGHERHVFITRPSSIFPSGVCFLKLTFDLHIKAHLTLKFLIEFFFNIHRKININFFKSIYFCSTWSFMRYGLSPKSHLLRFALLQLIYIYIYT